MTASVASLDGMATGAKVAVIGGSGLYDFDGLTEVELVRVPTPFGEHSDSIRIGKRGGVSVAFVARHGEGHRLLPSEHGTDGYFVASFVTRARP